MFAAAARISENVAANPARGRKIKLKAGSGIMPLGGSSLRFNLSVGRKSALRDHFRFMEKTCLIRWLIRLQRSRLMRPRSAISIAGLAELERHEFRPEGIWRAEGTNDADCACAAGLCEKDIGTANVFRFLLPFEAINPSGSLGERVAFDP